MLAFRLYLDAMDVVIALSAILAIVLLVLSFYKLYKSKILSSNIDNAFYKEVVKYLGGLDNIKEVSFLNSRLYVVLNDYDLLKYEKLQELGATGVLLVGNTVKCGFGDRAKNIYNIIK